MTKGWVSMNSDGSWTWWSRKPKLDREKHWYMKVRSTEMLAGADVFHRIDINEKVEDYTKSLRRYEEVVNE